MSTSCELTIFEGCDGSGKSTAARAYAEATGAKYVHLPALPGVIKGLGRLYIEAMMPALLGYQPVVMDRCWLSEEPYGAVFRPDKPLRVDLIGIRMLERVALRCGARLVWCDPGWEAVLASYRERKGEELLENEAQLKQVFGLYLAVQRPGGVTALPATLYDYTRGQNIKVLIDATRHTSLHPLANQTAGNWDAPVCLVGENFAERKDQDAWLQYPFVSFSDLGCSRWLTKQLLIGNVREDQLLWANADMDLSLLPLSTNFIAVGQEAGEKLTDFGLTYVPIAHPQHHKRFNNYDDYPIVEAIRALAY